jgi:hypothetical protein
MYLNICIYMNIQEALLHMSENNIRIKRNLENLAEENKEKLGIYIYLYIYVYLHVSMCVYMDACICVCIF